MSDVQVSVFGSWAHPDDWPRLFMQFAMTKTKYEIVVAGPTKPDYILPENVTFIHCTPDPGPCRCAQIAAQHCSGETLLMSQDDFVFSPFALDEMYNAYLSENNYKYMVHARWGTQTKDRTNECLQSMFITPNPKVRYGITLFSKRIFDELGGFDRRYNAGPYDADLQYRIYASGGKYRYASDAFVCEDRSLMLEGTDSAWTRLNASAEVTDFHKRWHSNGLFVGGSLLTVPTIPFEPIGENEITCSRTIVRTTDPTLPYWYTIAYDDLYRRGRFMDLTETYDTEHEYEHMRLNAERMLAPQTNTDVSPVPGPRNIPRSIG